MYISEKRHFQIEFLKVKKPRNSWKGHWIDHHIYFAIFFNRPRSKRQVLHKYIEVQNTFRYKQHIIARKATQKGFHRLFVWNIHNNMCLQSYSIEPCFPLQFPYCEIYTVYSMCSKGFPCIWVFNVSEHIRVSVIALMKKTIIIVTSKLYIHTQVVLLYL